MMTLQSVNQWGEAHDEEGEKKLVDNSFPLMYEVKSSHMAKIHHKVHRTKEI